MNSNTDPLVSIVIPMFNAKEWIVGLLTSVANQSYQNIEIILVNDGSTDSSLELVAIFSQQNPGINLRLISQENKGVSVARNEGVRISSGELIAFVDSDDIWMREKLEHQVREMVESKISAVACSYAIFDDTDLTVLDIVHPDWSTNGVRNWLLFRSYGGLLSSSLMITKESFIRTEPFRVDLSLSADIEFAWRLLKVTPVKLIQKPLVGYRLRPNQMHKLPSLLLAEAQRMLVIVDLLQRKRFRRIFLANLNLRLFLYRVQDRDLRGSKAFLLTALSSNSFEVLFTMARILSKRVLRRLKYSEKKSFSLPNP